MDDIASGWPSLNIVRRIFGLGFDVALCLNGVDLVLIQRVV